MSWLLNFILKRLFSIVLTLFLVSAAMYAVLMIYTPETRAELYNNSQSRRFKSDEERQAYIEELIIEYDLRAPYWKQYKHWVTGIFHGDLGYSFTNQDEVLNIIKRTAPATIELTLYSLLFLIPLGLFSGMLAGRKPGSFYDIIFRFFAFSVTSIPLFVLAFVLMAVFYVGLYWFPPGRLGVSNTVFVQSEAFRTYTGLLTLDGFLNGRWDISLEAFQHLVLPVVTLSLAHWATLGRVARVSFMGEFGKEYVLSAHARGLSNRLIIWRHVFRNVLTPVLTSSALSATALVGGVFVVELICDYKGVSSLIMGGFSNIPDPAAVMGFTLYSVVVVLLVMFVLDMLQILLVPQIRSEEMGS